METEKNTENVWKAEQKNKENVENQAYQISQERALEMLEELLEQDQFELLLPEYKLVYMMNDAVESCHVKTWQLFVISMKIKCLIICK